MFSDEEREAIAEAAAMRRLEAAALMAVIEVESGGRTFAWVGGRREPLIRWEGHYFDRLCPPRARARARDEGLASPRVGEIANPASHTARWELLRRAASIDRPAALQSVSWGIGQVMGEHWAWLGYASVEDLVTAARSSFSGQLDLMLRYVDRAGLLHALDARDWHGFARGYNGPAYRRLGYHEKLRAAYARQTGTVEEDAVLRLGAEGTNVKRLQRLLSKHGDGVAVDGIFGARTAAALLMFQERHGLMVDGICGPLTWRALGAKAPSARNFDGDCRSMLLVRLAQIGGDVLRGRFRPWTRWK